MRVNIEAERGRLHNNNVNRIYWRCGLAAASVLLPLAAFVRAGM